MSISVVLAGGGTAGHVAPLLAVAQCLLRRDADTRITVIGTAEGLEVSLVPQAGFELRTIPRVPMPRSLSPSTLRWPVAFRAARQQAKEYLQEVSADVVVGFGGYVAPPVYLAARGLDLPIVVHEANARPGWANRLGARLTDSVACTFAGTPLPHARVTGMPLRREIATLDRRALRRQATEFFGLRAGLTTLLVMGGSLGAARLNATFGACAVDFAQADIQVIHLSGKGKTVSLPAVSDRHLASQQQPYVVREYCTRMDLALAAADFVVCRSGAGTVSELTAVGLPAAYVPLPIGNGEQRRNAMPVVAAGGGLLVSDADCTAPWVRQQLIPLLTDTAGLSAMSRAAAGLGIRDGDEQVSDMVVAAVRKAS